MLLLPSRSLHSDTDGIADNTILLSSTYQFLLRVQPVHVPVDEHPKSLVNARGSLPHFGISNCSRNALEDLTTEICLNWKKANYLHMPHNLTVLRIHKFHVQVEGAADPVVRDHWGEDLRAVHLNFNLVAREIRTQDLLALSQ